MSKLDEKYIFLIFQIREISEFSYHLAISPNKIAVLTHKD